MRLIHLADFGGPYTGSFIPMLRTVMNRARQAGWEAELVFSAPAEDRPWLHELDRDGYAHRIAPDVGRRQLAGWIREVLAESDDPTLLHTHFTRFDIPAVLATRDRSLATVIWHFHSALDSRLWVRARNNLKCRYFGRRINAAFCVAPDMAEELVARGLPGDKLDVFPNAINTDRFRPAGTEERDWARSILGLGKDSRVLLHFGWDWHLKGGDRLVDALRILRDKGEESVMAVTVSGGDQTGSPEAPGDSPGLRVVGPMEEVALLYAAADLFISASRWEGQPYAVLEALSSGVPVLASHLPGHAQIADLVPSCELVDMEDPVALAAGIHEALARPAEIRRREADAGRQAVAENFGLDAWADRLFAKYDGFASR